MKISIKEKERILNRQNQIIVEQVLKIKEFHSQLYYLEQLGSKDKNHHPSLNQISNCGVILPSMHSSTSLVSNNRGQALTNLTNVPFNYSTLDSKINTPLTYAEREQNKREANLLETCKNKQQRR